MGVDSDGYPALPRGRHHLTREQVSASQRERLIHGMTAAVGEKGYARTSVADVLKRAHVSRETFYEHFTDKQACFLAAYQATADRVTRVVSDALAVADQPLMQRVEGALRAYLREMAGDAGAARTLLLEVYAAGPAAAALRKRLQDRFTDMAAALLAEDERFRRLPDPDFACRMLVGGIASLVTGQVAVGEHATLPALSRPILTYLSTLLTYTPGR